MDEKGTICLRGNVFQVQADKAFAFPPPPPHFPQLALHHLSHPLSKGGTHRPVKRCVSPISDGLGECGVQWCYEVTAPFLSAQEFGRADEASASDSSPRVAGYWF